MKTFFGAAVLCLLAAPAWGEVGTVTCDTARAVSIGYRLYTNPDGPTELLWLTGQQLVRTGAVCLERGQSLAIDAAGMTFIFAHPSQGHQLTIQRSDEEDGQADAEILAIDLLYGKSLYLPLARRHAYDRQKDGGWRYVPLRTDYWGQLELRIGNPDIGVNEPGGSPQPSLLPVPGDINISKLVQ
jgi:hypothetical protein